MLIFVTTTDQNHIESGSQSSARLGGLVASSKLRASVRPIPRVDLSYHRYTQLVCDQDRSMQGTPLSHVTRHSAPGPNGLVAASACGFQNAKAAGFEADDFLAAAAPKEEKRGGTVLIASGDRDTFQLASDRTTIHYPVRAGETARIDPAEFRVRYGVDPRQVRILSPCAVIPKGRRAGAIVGAESTRRPARRACDRLGRTIGRFRS
jgi:hypothetical protein